MWRALFCVLLIAGILPAAPLRVLVLHSYHKADWTDSINSGIQSVLDTIPGVELTYDYLDTKKDQSPEYLGYLEAAFHHKYAKLKFDAAIVADDQAFHFFLEKGPSIWGRIPMSFCGVNVFADSMITGHSEVTGVVEQGNFKTNLEFALRARPQAKIVHIIADSSQTGLSNLAELLETLQGFPQLVPRIHQRESFAELGDQLSHADPKDFAFFISFWKDKNGVSIYPDTLGKLFSRASVPVFGRSEWLVGKGETGGLCVSGARQGRSAALRLLALLQGHNPIPVLKESPNQFLFDYTLLEHFQIPRNLLPSDAILVHLPSPFLKVAWETVVIIGFVLGIFILVVLFAAASYRRQLHLLRILGQRDAEYRLLVESQNDLVVKVDRHNRILFLSPSYCRYFQQNTAQLMGQNILSLVVEEDRAATLRAMEKLNAAPFTAYLEQRVNAPSGVRWFGWNNKAVLNTYGEVEAVIAVGRDITDRKLIEQEREQLIAELESKNYELERYAYTVSHDLRSPLVTIMGFASEMALDLDEAQYDEAKEDAARIKESALRMSLLLNGILQVSRAGRLTNSEDQISMEQLVKAVAEISLNLKARGVELEIQTDLPKILGDAQRIHEVVQNLMENACKYMGSQASPRIRIWAKSEHEFNAFCVEDNGMGIEPKHHERIFGLFNKLDSKSDGIGVGLALVKRIIESSHGRVWVESEGLGKGSRFWFTVPKVK